MRAPKSAASPKEEEFVMKKRLVQALAAPRFDDDQLIPSDLVGRLYGARQSAVADLMAGYSPAQRANLAMLFYRKAHLRPIGLAIAATCDFPSLVEAWGPARGQALFDQSHECPPASPRGRRKITLARFPTFHLQPATSSSDEEPIDRIAA
jgi:hypothetical protein